MTNDDPTLLFILATQGECSRIAAHAGLSAKNYHVLTAINTEPYFVNLRLYHKNLISWGATNLVAIDLERYWLDNYIKIEKLVRQTIAKKNLKITDGRIDQHLLLPIVWQLGSIYSGYVDIIEQLISSSPYTIIQISKRLYNLHMLFLTAKSSKSVAITYVE